MFSEIAKALQVVGDTILFVILVAFSFALALHVFGWPGFVFDKILKSKFGKDILFPLKSLFRKFR